MVIASLFFLAGVLLISTAGLHFGLYKKGILWFGRLMHFSGGFFVGMFATGFTHSLVFIIGFTFLVGVLWEVGEYCFGFFWWKKYGTKKYMTELWGPGNTIEDLVLDFVGAAAWVLVYFAAIGYFIAYAVFAQRTENQAIG